MISASNGDIKQSLKASEDSHMVKVAKATLELSKRNTLGQLSGYEKSKLAANTEFLADMIIKGVN